MQELLNIGQFCQKNFNKNLKNKNPRKIGASSWYCWKALDEFNILKLLFTLGAVVSYSHLGQRHPDVTSVNGIVKSANVDGWIET